MSTTEKPDTHSDRANSRNSSASSADDYRGKAALLTTKHGKEQAVAPVMERLLGLTVNTPPETIDTDQLGSFTGEIARRDDMRKTVLRKAHLGLKQTGMRIGLATEASFGPHPSIPFAPLHLELICFVDLDRKLEIIEQIATPETNFSWKSVRSSSELSSFLEKIGFPDQGLIVRPNKTRMRDTFLGSPPIFKAITDHSALEEAIQQASAHSKDGTARVETDMRAMVNPQRMAKIGELSEKLAARIHTHCPSCGAPGWGRTGSEKGLPCSSCGLPTELVRYETFRCVSCSHTEKQGRSDGMVSAEPTYCPFCNP